MLVAVASTGNEFRELYEVPLFKICCENIILLLREIFPPHPIITCLSYADVYFQQVNTALIDAKRKA